MTESQESTNKPNAPEQESDQSVLNRRQFIGFGASAAAAALTFPKAAQAYVEFPGITDKARIVAQKFTPTTPTNTSLTPPSDNSFVQPNVIASKVNGNDNYGTLSSSLDVVKKDYTDLTTDPTPMTYVRAFNQVDPPVSPTQALAPAPTLSVNPGDSIELTVNNTLATNNDSTYCPNPFPGDLMNHPNCFNTINMHFHGLHVSPISIDKDGKPISAGENENVVKSSDDVLYELEPKTKPHAYCPWLPAFHAPGTHWYHAHRHGSTAIQVAGGMVGAIIVNEPPGQEICPGAPDVVMVIQEEPQSLTENDYTDRGVFNPEFNELTPQEKLDRGIYERKGPVGGGTTGKFLVNGVSQPTLKLQKDEIQRWRLINANSTPRAFMGLELRAGTDITGKLQTIYRIAVDGITLYGKKMTNSSVKFDTEPVPFALGNRVDLLVKLDPGIYTLWKRKDNINASRASADEALVTITVDNTTTFDNAKEVAASFKKLMDNGIPETGKPDYLKPIKTVDQENQIPVLFQANGGTPPNRVTTPGRGNFRISNTKYSLSNNNIEADLNSTQEWIIANNSGAAHPFHIHVNPFLVVASADISDVSIANTDTNQEIYDKLTANSVQWNDQDDGIWWDTFSIAPNKAYKIRHRFDDYWGTYVLHCHVLIHEDQGMMWNVKIKNVDGKGANPCQQLLEPVVISNNAFTTGTIIALQADTGKWLSRCNNCQQTVGNNYPDTITVHIDNPDSSNPYAQFEILDVGGGKIALKADTGKYVARCRNCIINGAYPDFLTVHVDDPSVPYAQFTPELLDNGKYALKADTGKYVARCRNCSTGAAYPDTVTIHVDDPTDAPYAQWSIKRIK